MKKTCNSERAGSCGEDNLYIIPFRFQRITRRQGGGDEAYFTYVEEADDAANKVSQRKRRYPAKKVLSDFFHGR
jgi:hypothetical protein